MRLLLIAAAAMLALAGCQTATDADSKASEGLAKICPSASLAYTGYQGAVLFGIVKPSAAVDQAWAFLGPLCADPSRATSSAVLRQAADALDAIRDAN